MTTIVGALLAAAATPVPVHVQNWPSPPGPDAVALDTLRYARWAFWATVASAIIAIVGVGFGAVDYALNIRQFRRPRMSVSLAPNPNTVIEAQQDATYARIKPYVHSDDDRNYRFKILLQLNNSGTSAAKCCYVAMWLPNDLRIDTTDWHELDKSKRSVWGFPPGAYTSYETFVDTPVFVEHPILLPSLDIKSRDGPTQFDMYWQVFDESGMRESKRTHGIRVTVVADNLRLPPGS